MQKPELMRLKDFAKAHNDIVKLPTLRKHIAKGAPWVRRIGKLVYVDVNKFFEWTEAKK